MFDSDAIDELAAYAEETGEALGTTQYAIDVSHGEVAHLTRGIISEIYTICGASHGNIATWSVSEHNRGYGDMRRFTLHIIVSVPKSPQSARIIRKKLGGTGEDVPVTETVLYSTEFAIDRGNDPSGLTNEEQNATVVPQATDNENSEKAPRKRR